MILDPDPSTRRPLGAAATLLAVDGGQTATRAVVLRPDAAVLLRAETGPLVHALQPGGGERLETVLGSIARDVAAAGFEPDVVFLGLTAVTPGTPSEDLGRAVARALWPTPDLVVEGDGIVAWAGATGAVPGVVAMAGTGSVVVAVNEAGEAVQAGGWGYLLGDPGSGWHVGNTTVRRMLQRWDRDRVVSPLGRAILDAVSATDPQELSDRIYADDIDLVRVARLTEVVARLAHEGDAEAWDILSTCAPAFVPDVVAAIGRLAWAKEPVLVAIQGGTFRTGEPYRSAFGTTLEATSPRRVRLADPVLSGLGGAALLALRQAGVPPTSTVVDRLIAQGLGPDPGGDG